MADLAEHAAALRALHHADAPLVLPNVWDADSGRAVAEAGFPAVATTSAGVAKSLGFADHQQAPADEVFAAVARIARVLALPLTADLEAGYGLAARELVERLLAAGAVGCNLEDTDHQRGELANPDVNARYLADVKAAARAAGVDVVLNARVDVFLRGEGAPEARLEEALARGRLYREAGADCIYPILAPGRETLRALAEGLDGPVNAMARPGGLSVPELAALGIRRISFGGGLFAAGQDDFRKRLAAIRSEGGYST